MQKNSDIKRTVKSWIDYLQSSTLLATYGNAVPFSHPLLPTNVKEVERWGIKSFPKYLRRPSLMAGYGKAIPFSHPLLPTNVKEMER